MNPKAEAISYETIVNDALARMHALTSAAPAYEVDRSSGQWVVKRASTTGAVFAYDLFAAATEGPTPAE